MPAVPGSVLEVAAQPRQPGFDVADFGERRHGAADAGIEVGMRPAPVRAEEAVGAIVGNEQRAALEVAQHLL